MEPEKPKEAAASQPMEAEAGGDPVDPRELVSSDDEIDYSAEPEFYDPELDDADERWVNRQRKGRTSDAVLSCPACFTTLCLDCQRHEIYVNQYRAMFVRNCKVKTDQILREGKGKRKNRKGKAANSSATSEGENKGAVYHPVCCEVCSTEVGVFDEDEVYHFFNVIPSNS
ncbi:E2F-associated phosphoprotein [Oryza brachyantha]|uniref:E2F-associated phosphoprotein n=1 Tax=Oryza brachyantha TaxID=4533 RepID=UPI001ADA11F1|nr:E2F-associated phosphoprotein [Oryza brachyantha]